MAIKREMESEWQMAIGRDEMFVVQDTIQYIIADIQDKRDNEKSRIMMDLSKEKLIAYWESRKDHGLQNTFFSNLLFL